MDKAHVLVFCPAPPGQLSCLDTPSIRAVACQSPSCKLTLIDLNPESPYARVAGSNRIIICPRLCVELDLWGMKRLPAGSTSHA